MAVAVAAAPSSLSTLLKDRNLCVSATSRQPWMRWQSKGERPLRRCYVTKHQSVSVRAAVSADVEDQLMPSYRTIVKSGEDELDICRALNGLWQVSSPAWGASDPAAAADAMLAYADAGLTTFDLADIYGPAESLYGVLLNRARRERGEEYASHLEGLTKWCPPPAKITRAVVEDAMYRSRKRMETPKLDMVQFHWWDYSDKGYLDALKHLTDLKEEGKIKTIALTNFDTDRLQTILENGIPVVSNQVQYSLVDTRPQQRMAELCSLTGVQLLTYGTLLGGFLSEKFVDSKEPNSWGGPRTTTPSQNKYKRMIDTWGGWGLFQELLRECQIVARKHKSTIPAVAVHYILDQPAVAGSILGVRLGVSEHIDATCAIFDLQLDEEDRERIRKVMKKSRDLMAIIGDCGDEYR